VPKSRRLSLPLLRLIRVPRRHWQPTLRPCTAVDAPPLGRSLIAGRYWHGRLGGYLFTASQRPGVGTGVAVSQSRQRLECGDLSPLFSASASQLAADSHVPRAKAPTSWRTPNAAATAKTARSLPSVVSATC